MQTTINTTNPEIGRIIQTGEIRTNYQDVGSGAPVLLLHGSGPGVSAWVNWRGVLSSLQDEFRLVAPDLAGFGYSDVPDGIQYSRAVWLRQIVDFLDALKLDQVDVVGNSLAGQWLWRWQSNTPNACARSCSWAVSACRSS